MRAIEYVEEINNIKGKTIGIVYVFENNCSAPRNYDAWEGDVLSNWVHAVYELHGLPLVMDVQTFVEKLSKGTLPPIDFVINLSNGYFDISSLGLVPSICTYYKIPCIPCNASMLLTGENKRLSNLIAQSLGFYIPQLLDKQTPTSITRPNSLGSSYGVHRGAKESEPFDHFIQEFIPGLDVTIGILYNPIENCLSIQPAVAYVPDSMDPQWFFGEKEKQTHVGHSKRIVQIDSHSKKQIETLIKVFDITTYCRIDFRAKCNTTEEIQHSLTNGLSWDQLNFIEINLLPTIKAGNNFCFALEHQEPDATMSTCYQLYQSNVRNATLTGFILSCSILSIKAKH